MQNCGVVAAFAPRGSAQKAVIFRQGSVDERRLYVSLSMLRAMTSCWIWLVPS
jgi:hypothetical protein